VDRGRVKTVDRGGARALLVAVAIASALLAILVAGRPAVSQVPASPADVNCDGETSSADVVAAVVVSYDAGAFPDCTAADPYRGRVLTEDDLLGIEREIFNFFDTPLTPTISRTPTISGTPTQTRTATATFDTRTPTRSRTPSSTRTGTVTHTATPSQTETPAVTATQTVTPSRSRTLTPSVTRTPTGVAARLAGDWNANWGNTICFLNGTPFTSIADVTYRVTALNERLDIVTTGGLVIGRGLVVAPDGSVDPPPFIVPTGEQCQISGRPLQFEFDYFFTFSLNGTGTGSATWSYGKDSFCAVCSPVLDQATLVRVSGP